MRGLIVLEGADSSGKTTLAKRIVQRTGARYLHHYVYDHPWVRHYGSLRLAERWIEQGHLVVLDRLWLSELAYGQAYRNGSQYPESARCLDRAVRRLAGVTVICVPEDLQKQIRRFNDEREGRREYVQDVRPIVQLYADLRWGNAAHPGDSYLDHLIRWGDYVQRGDVTVYDLDRDGGDLDEFILHLSAKLRQLRAFQYGPALERRYWNFLGHLDDAKYVFVGDKLSSGERRWPMMGNTNSPLWLNKALQELSFDETRGLWTNVYEDDGYPHLRHLAGKGYKFICLGRRAERAVTKLGRVRYARVPHPAWAKRFQHHAFDAYVELLKEALS